MMVNDIILDRSTVPPETPIYMLNHIGGIDQSETKSSNGDGYPSKRSDLDNDPKYVNEQLKIINNSNNTIYKKVQHDESYDGCYDRIYNKGFDRGFDYRDWPRENTQNQFQNQMYDPLTGYLHKNGLIGKNKSRYDITYINIDSHNRRKQTDAKISKIIKLDNNSLKFIGSQIKIYVSDSDLELLNINDKIIINNTQTNEITLRSSIIDCYGKNINYFLLCENECYMTIDADTNMRFDASMTDIISDITDIKVELEGFLGDKKTSWYFDTKMFEYTIENIAHNKYLYSIFEDLYAISKTTGEKKLALIGQFTTDIYGEVIDINSDMPFRYDDLCWTENINNIILEEYVPEEYYTDAKNKIQNSNNNNNNNNIPNTIYDAFNYLEQIQNIIRPIFYKYMSNNIIFNKKYTDNNKKYNNYIRICIPESTEIINVNTIGNIPLNKMNTIHKMCVNNEINNVTQERFYIKLDKIYKKRIMETINPYNTGALVVSIYENTVSDITIKYKHVGGVPIDMIDAGYPLKISNIKGFRYIRDIIKTNIIDKSKKSYIVVDIDRHGYYDNFFGGCEMYIGIIDDIYQGYENPNSYCIDLEKVYSNVIGIKMISSCFPKTHPLLTDGLNVSGRKRNNRFYWQNLNDGEKVYRFDIDPGNYDLKSFKKVFEDQVKKNSLNTLITLDINESSGKVTLSSYNIYMPINKHVFSNKIKLSELNNNSISQSNNTINGFNLEHIDNNYKEYYKYPTGEYFVIFKHNNKYNNKHRVNYCDGIILTIHHPQNSIKVGDIIKIENSNSFEDISATCINGEHIVTRILGDYYDIIITDIKYIDICDKFDNNSIIIYTPNMFRIRFDYDDTFGSILGFRDIGLCSSITNYNYEITNTDLYMSEDNDHLSYICERRDKEKSIITKPYINFCGPEYLLITCEQIGKSRNLGDIKDYFYRINLPKKHDLFIFNSFVNAPLYFLNDPIAHLDRLEFDIYAPDGSYYDFNGYDHSFVLEITTYEETPENTNLVI